MSENDENRSTENASLLVIVFDTNPNQNYIKKDPDHFTKAINSIVAFGNTHLMLKPNNKLAVLACHHHKSEFLYPNPKQQLDVRQIDGQYEYFTLIEKTIKSNVTNLIKTAPKQTMQSESLLAGSLAMVLCYIARIKRQQNPGQKLHCRILIVTGSADVTHQYMSYMNVFFTAQKEKVVLDICTLDKDLALLQQGCDITGGQYLKVPQIEGLLQYLLVRRFLEIFTQLIKVISK